MQIVLNRVFLNCLYIISLMSDSSFSSSSDELDEDSMMIEMLIHLPRPMRFRCRSNLLEEYDDLDFKCHFRLSKETFTILAHMIGENMKHRSSSLSPELQILIDPRYYATGTYQWLT